MKLTQTLLEWVLTSAFLILAVTALRALLGRRVSAGLRYALWAVVLVRLLVPVSISMGVTVPKLPAWEPPEVTAVMERPALLET